LLETTRLDPRMIDWGLTTTLKTLDPNVLRALSHTRFSSSRCLPSAHRLVAVVLSGNLFSSALRALYLPLLAGANVIAKASSHDDALPRALKRALDRIDPAIGERLEIVNFHRDDHDATRALLAHADAVSVYGDDDTLRAIAEQCRPETRFIAHGHGLAAAHVGRDALTTLARARDAADRLALDIAAYDQRGCLSPHVVLVEPGAAIDPAMFAALLARESLPLMAALLPIGEADAHERAAQLQWQAVAAARGELFADTTHSVSFEGEQTIRPSPGGRLIGVYSCASLAHALEPFRRHLKCVGTSDRRLPPSAAGRDVAICRLGAMQTPSFDDFADGRPPLDGLFGVEEFAS
jgi:hypothetical protein